jgi:GNAT superfamily N-acetyltransferase
MARQDGGGRVTVAESLRAAQAARFAGLDPLLPAAAPDPEGELLTAALPSGRRVAGTLTRTSNRPGAAPSLWSARDAWELFPLVGDDVGDGLDALLRAWRGLLDATGVPGRDSSCTVTWPSRDAEGTRVLLAHGFVPLSVLAVRRPPGGPEPATGASGTVVRRAAPRDLAVAVQLALAEMEYSALVGSTILREDAAELKRDALAYRITHGDPVWLAERDGVAIAIAESWLTDSDPQAGRRFPVPPGRWGYVNAVSVLPGARGTGVGRALMSVVHRDLHRNGATGTYLYYNPPNPLSSVFWPRQGYRPLWTIWEIRPAGALR